MMRTAEGLMQELCSLDESHHIEAKRASQIDRSVLETVCAFANEPGLGGGYLLLGLARELGAIDNAAYRSINRTDTLSASSHLRRLRDLGLLDMRGGGNRTYYVSGQAFAESLSLAAAPDRRQPPGNGYQPDQDSHHLGQNSHQDLVTIPEALKIRIPVAGTKPRREVLRALILDLCQWRALSARDLASILGRQEHKPLVRDHLSPMVAEGLLAYTMPEMENHPDQRYTVPNPID